MQVFVNHNSDQGLTVGYRREESVEIEPVVKARAGSRRENKIEKKGWPCSKRFARMAAAFRHPCQNEQSAADEGNRRVGGCL